MSSEKGYVLVTGAARRVGRAVALELARAGWDIVVHANASMREAAETARLARAFGRDTLTVKADFGEAAAVDGLIPSLAAQGCAIRALVNNAALFLRDEKDADGALHQRINCQAPVRLTRALREHLGKESGMGAPLGAVVNLLDATPLPPFLSAYRASKQALEKATLELARGLAPGVRVNAIAVGPCARGVRETQAHFDRMVEATPMGAAVTPESVAQAVRFLLENAAVTGVILPVDAGAHLTGPLSGPQGKAEPSEVA